MKEQEFERFEDLKQVVKRMKIHSQIYSPVKSSQSVSTENIHENLCDF